MHSGSRRKNPLTKVAKIQINEVTENHLFFSVTHYTWIMTLFVLPKYMFGHGEKKPKQQYLLNRCGLLIN